MSHTQTNLAGFPKMVDRQGLSCKKWSWPTIPRTTCGNQKWSSGKCFSPNWSTQDNIWQPKVVIAIFVHGHFTEIEVMSSHLSKVVLQPSFFQIGQQNYGHTETWGNLACLPHLKDNEKRTLLKPWAQAAYVRKNTSLPSKTPQSISSCAHSAVKRFVQSYLTIP